MPLRLIGVAGIVVVVALGVIATIPQSSTLSDLAQTVAYACGYNAGAEMVLGHAVGEREWCKPIKATAAANGFNQP